MFPLIAGTVSHAFPDAQTRIVHHVIVLFCELSGRAERNKKKKKEEAGIYIIRGVCGAVMEKQ